MNLQDLILNQIILKPMELALSLAKQGQYTVSPNPMVGAVILRDTKLVGYGCHLYRGDFHAESKAIDMAGNSSRGAILYLNLEPCSHYGLTDPCVDKIIESGIIEVNFSSKDPNPLVNGSSVNKLKQAGIKVVVGELKEEAEALNENFYYYMRSKKPFVIAKWAMTMDGKISTKHDSKWISGEASRNHTHKLRNSVDAIIVGASTALKDNPTLNIRCKDLKIIRQPLKFIIGSHLDALPMDYNLFNINSEKTYIIHDGEFDIKKQKILQDKGVNFIQINKLENGDFDLHQLLDEMASLSVTSLLIEGGGFTLSKWLQANLINKFYCYIAPKFIAGRESIHPFNQDIGIDFIKDAKQAKFTKMEMLGEDILMQGRF